MRIMPTRAIICFLVFVFFYGIIYYFGFDDIRAFDEAKWEPEFRSSPKWVKNDIFLRGVTLLGRRTSIWNYIFFPAEWVSFKIYPRGNKVFLSWPPEPGTSGSQSHVK